MQNVKKQLSNLLDAIDTIRRIYQNICLIIALMILIVNIIIIVSFIIKMLTINCNYSCLHDFYLKLLISDETIIDVMKKKIIIIIITETIINFITIITIIILIL